MTLKYYAFLFSLFATTTVFGQRTFTISGYAVKNVTLTKGGFPARFGGRLSSIIEIDMKEGNMKEFHGEGGIGIIASRATLEGPIVKDKASFMISARRT